MKSFLFFKKLTLVGLFFAAVSSSNSFAQDVYTQNTSGPGICDGSAYLDSAVIAVANDIQWIQVNTTIQQGGTYVGDLCEGTYTVTYTDGSGNPITMTFTIGANSPNPCSGFVVYATGSNVSNPNFCDGTASVQVNGGTAPYVYSWSNNDVTSTISNLCVGSYTCQVYDANGCLGTTNVNIGDNSINNVDTTITIINNTFPGDSTLDVIGNQMIEDCNLDIIQIGGATITNATVSNDGVDLTWTLTDLQGNTLATYNVNYPIVIDSNGVYQATVVITCFGKSLDTYQITIVDQVQLSQAVSINENNLEGIKFNNPINEALNVQFPTTGNYNLTIVDLSGKKVAAASYMNVNEASVNTNYLKSGAYLLTVTSGTAQVSIKLIK
ncbi:MAG: T9SS type A sorting domain-containing protein [Flavobacteriales bacterium]|nr:T9SS type A sorting domain-containing protein [Flavobacteriales bacterium]